MKEAFERITELLYDNNVHADQKIEGLVDDIMYIVSEVEAEYINKSTEHINKSSDCSTGWIPVEERLPETDDDVLIYYQYKIMQGVNVVGWKETQGVGYYYSPSNDWIFYGGFGLDRHAIAWMPLPEPYRRKEQG